MGLYDTDSVYVKFKYTTYVDWTPTSKLFYVYSGNSAWDPDVTSTGLTAAGFNAHMARYQRCLVMASKIVTRTTCTATLTPFGRVVVLPCLDATDPGYNTTSWEATNQKYARTRWLSGVSNGPSYSVIRHYMTTKKIFGTTATYDQGYSHGVSSNPDSTKRWYWTLLLDLPYQAVDDETVHTQVQITYYCKLYQLYNNATIETVL